MGYHKRKITKGYLGQFSKIQEEIEELQDAHDQSDPILELCEMADLIGAIEAYAYSQYNIPLDDILRFKDKTIQSFNEGKRS